MATGKSLSCALRRIKCTGRAKRQGDTPAGSVRGRAAAPPENLIFRNASVYRRMGCPRLKERP